MSANKKPIVCANSVELFRTLLHEFGFKEAGDRVWQAHSDFLTAMNDLRNALMNVPGNLMIRHKEVQELFQKYENAFNNFVGVFGLTADLIDIKLPKIEEVKHDA
jgi:hypothetical protein